MKNKKKTIQLNAPLRKLPKGAKIDIEVDAKGTPIELYWRDRFKDAKKDKCVEFVDKKTVGKSSTKTMEVNRDAD